MIFKSIYLQEGMFERKIVFNKSNNLIYSKKNSRGKTTLLRLMLYGLGYNIPNTKNIKFNKCNILLEVESEISGTIFLKRDDNNSIEVMIQPSTEKRTYVLPEQFYELQKLLWGTSNPDILNNLLGAYYIDQEKGWTLLNRGVVIGSIHFNIEELIRGLSKIDCSELIAKEKNLEREIAKYKQIHNVAQYRASLEETTETLLTDTYEVETDNTLDMLINEQRKIKTELRRVDSTLSDNKRFRKFIADMKLLVQSPDGTVFPVTEQSIVGLNDSIDLLITKRKSLSVKYSQVTNMIEKLQQERERDKMCNQLSFFESETSIEKFDKSISRLPINPIVVKQELDGLQKEIKGVREEISRITKLNNSMSSVISETIIKYATELGIGDKDSIPVSYLFTSNLKELSGAILHKTAFAFRLAYIIAIEKVINVKMPIILDSPSGKEVDHENIQLMMNILKRDFSDHQIIIASIYSYDLSELNIISIDEHLIDQPIVSNEESDAQHK